MIFNVITMTIADVSMISADAPRRTLSNNEIYLDINVRSVRQKAGLYAFSMQAGFGWIERAFLFVKVAWEATF